MKKWLFVNSLYTIIDILPLNLSFLFREFENLQKFYVQFKKLEKNFNRKLESKWTFSLNNDIESALNGCCKEKKTWQYTLQSFKSLFLSNLFSSRKLGTSFVLMHFCLALYNFQLSAQVGKLLAFFPISNFTRVIKNLLRHDFQSKYIVTLINKIRSLFISDLHHRVFHNGLK